MIDITNIKTYYPPIIQNNEIHILREYLQYKILQYIFHTEESQKLCFIWWTALRIGYNSQRFSEDLDFDNFNLNEKEFENITKYIKKNLELEGYKVDLKHIYKGAYHCHIKIPNILYENNLAAMPTQKIIIKMDTVWQDFNFIPKAQTINQFDVTTQIKIAPIDLLLSHKITTIFNRKRTKWRDFFDIIFILSQTKKPNYQFLQKKIWVKNNTELKKYILNWCKSLNFKALQADVAKFLFNPHDQSVELFPDYIEQIEFE